MVSFEGLHRHMSEEIRKIPTQLQLLTNSMAYGTHKFIAAVTNVRHWILS